MQIFLLFVIIIDIYVQIKLSSFMSSLQKKNFFLPFYSSIFYSKMHKHPACKMDTYEHGESRLKIRSFE